MKDKWQRDSGSLILTRRSLLLGTGAVAAGLAFGSAWVLPGSASAAQPEEPKRGGRVRLATSDSSSADSLDPLRVATFTDILRSYFIYEKLTEVDADGLIVPQLAVEWSSNKEATQWIFKLRDGVVFHNGKTLTSADVVHSFQRVMDEKNSSNGRNYLAEIKEIKANGQDVVFELSSPNAEFPFIVSMRWMAIVPTEATQFPRDAIGTGPWRVGDFNPGISSLFTRNENYWRAGLPYISEIESFGVSDESSRLSALLAGDADIVQGISPRTLPTIKRSGNALPWVATSASHCTFVTRVGTPPYDNLHMRLALKNSFDREALIKTAFGGLGEVGRDNPIPSFDPNFNAAVPIPAADPDKVKFHLNKAGAANFPVVLDSSDANFGGTTAAVVLAEMMKANGINASVRKNPADSYWSAVYMKTPFFTSSWSVRPTTITRIEGGYTKTSPYNESGWYSEKVDSLVAQAKAELDMGRRMEMLSEAQTIISTEGASIIPFFLPWIDAHSTRVRGLKGARNMCCGSGLWAEAWLADS